MKTAMILAAGRGERLKPLTNKLPKALCAVQGKPLIEHHLRALATAGFQRVIINHAYLGGLIRAQLGTGQHFGLTIQYTPEPPGGLETGGGIVNALPLLGNEPFVTINADIFTDYPLANLQLPSSSMVHIILVPKPDYVSQGDFGLSNVQLANTNKLYTFSGIACYRSEIFNICKPGRYSVAPLIRQLAEVKRATGELYNGVWHDIGSRERLMECVSRMKDIDDHVICKV